MVTAEHLPTEGLLGLSRQKSARDQEDPDPLEGEEVETATQEVVGSGTLAVEGVRVLGCMDAPLAVGRVGDDEANLALDRAPVVSDPGLERAVLDLHVGADVPQKAGRRVRELDGRPVERGFLPTARPVERVDEATDPR